MRMANLALCLTLSTASAISAGDGGHRASSELIAAVPSDSLHAEAASEYLERASAFGVSGALLIGSRGHVLLSRGYGTADRNTGASITSDTPFFIGSLAKQFTATAILRLEMDGRLSRDDSLGRWLPNVPPDKAGITLRQLLTHTSGLPYLPAQNLLAPASRATVIRDVLALPLQFVPGSRYSYSTPGYNLLAAVVEQASNKSFEDYLTTTLFAPAGMTHTVFVGTPAAAALASAPHSYSGDTDEGSLATFPRIDRGVGAGTVITTVDDFYRWFLAIRTGRILAAPQMRDLFAAAVSERPGVSASLGWNVATDSLGDSTVYHAGDIGGYNAEFRWDRGRDLVVIFFSNARTAAGGYREAAVPRLMSLLSHADSDSPTPLPPRVAQRKGSAFAQDTGVFESDGAVGVHMHLTITSDTLRVEPSRQRTFTLMSAIAASDTAASVLNRRAEALESALRRGDTIGLFSAMQASPLAAPYIGSAAQQRSALTDSLGAVRDADVAGSVISTGLYGHTYVRVRFEHGSRTIRYNWRNGQLWTTSEEQNVPSMPFMPAFGNANEFVEYDPFTDRGVRLIFEKRNLTIITPADSVHARLLKR